MRREEVGPISSTYKPHHDILLQGGSVDFFMEQIKAPTTCSGKGYTSCSSHISVICQQQTPVPPPWRPYLLPTHPHPLLFPPLLMYYTISILSHFFLYPGDESGSFFWNISKFLPCYTVSWAGYISRYSDWLRSGIPVEARFFAPVQTCPGAHPASCTMGTGSFPVVKSGRGVTLTPHPF